MDTFAKVKIEDKEILIAAADTKMCALTVGGIQYTVPEAVGGLIARLGEQVEKEQQRRRKDDEDILEFIKKQSAHIAYALSGGDKNSVAYYGENLLKHSLGEKVPLPAGIEYDDGSTTQEFYGVVAERIRLAIGTARDMRGRMMAKLDGSEMADNTAFL